MKERWRPVPGYDGYDISNKGRVRSWLKSKGGMRREPKILKGWEHKGGGWKPSYGIYRAFTLRRDGTSTHFSAHRLVAQAFLKPPLPDQIDVAHKDGDPSNNDVSNLRWSTRRENCADTVSMGRARGGVKGEGHGKARLTDEIVRSIRKRSANGERYIDIGRSLGITGEHVSGIVRRKDWRHVL